MTSTSRPVRPPARRVFLSHTSDLRTQPPGRSYVAAAEEAVHRCRHAVVDMQYFTANDAPPADVCIDTVAQADIYVGIIGPRYGAVVPGRQPELSYTELEFMAASELAMPRLVFLVDDPTCPNQQPPDHVDRQAAFRRRLRTLGMTVARVTSPAELEVKLHQALVELEARSPQKVAGVPHELPRPPADFTGRVEELALLRELLARRPEPARAGHEATVVISAVDGMAGIGKSALAIHAAHQVAEAAGFPDGQLYVNLQGANAAQPPLTALDALGHMLRSLGVDPAAIPTDTEEAAARFRSLAAGRRLLVLLDNASSAEQVRLLLPGSATCAVLVTSREVLATLEGTRSLHLDALPREQALELLGRIAGAERVAAEPEAAAAVADWCGRLPLAIRIAGARLAARPRWPIAGLAEQLADATRRLQALEVGELAVRASFDVSLHALQRSPDAIDREAAAALGLLSLPDGPDLGLPAACRLLDRSEDDTLALLDRLVGAQLLQMLRSERYHFHDLVRLYAREHASRQPEPERVAALTRVIGFYTATGWRTMEMLYPGTWRIGIADRRWATGGLALADAPAARSWLTAERSNLLAAIAQSAAAVTAGAPAIPAQLPCQLIQSLFGFFFVCSYWQDWVEASETALRVATQLDDQATLALACNDIGIVCGRFGRYEEAIANHEQSLRIFRRHRIRSGQAAGLSNLGTVYEWLGQCTRAIECQREGLAISTELGDRHGQARCLENLGVVYGRLRRFTEAIAHLEQGLEIGRECRNLQVQARCLNNLGNVHARRGRPDDAIASLSRALELFEEVGDRQGRARCLNHLGLALAAMGRDAEAAGSQEESLTICRELGDTRGMVLALRDLGDACRAIGQADRARSAWQEGVGFAEALRLPEADEIRSRLAGLEHDVPGD